MKYFTPELWASWQSPDYVEPPPETDPFLLYAAELETLRGRLPFESFAFFSTADVHDGESLSFAVTDGNRPAPLGQPRRPWRAAEDYPVRVKLRVLDAMDKWLWTLDYSGVRRVIVQYARPPEPFGGFGFEDWGYHELSDAGDGFLRHEVLFRSESTLLIEFTDVVVQQEQARRVAEQEHEADGRAHG